MTATAEVIELRPQPGPQERFLASSADIAIMGGAVFGGKTWALTFEPLRHLHVRGFTAVTFRRTAPEIRNPGGLWDESMQMYPLVGGSPREHTLEWSFPSGASVKLAGLQYDKDVLGWKGAQICLLSFDQLEEFTEQQFWYLLSRNRSTCGVRPYVRATCNPDPDSWLRKFLAWWIDEKTGYAIPERSGVLRWFVRIQNELVWADSKAELLERYPDQGRYARSVTFVLARLQDNKIGNEKDPAYEAAIRSLPLVEQERLLGDDRGGNWNIRAAAGLVFNRAWFPIVDAQPAVVAGRIRGWDKAATPDAGDWTAGVRISRTADGLFWIEDVVRGQWGSGDRKAVVVQTAKLDGVGVKIRLEQEPGSGGKDSVAADVMALAGYDVEGVPSTKDKVTRAGPLAAQAKAGNVRLVKGDWNSKFLDELHAFPSDKVHDDQVDAASLAFNRLALHNPPGVRQRSARIG